MTLLKIRLYAPPPMTLLSTAMPNNVAAPSLVHDGDDWVDIPLTLECTLRARCVLRLRQEFNPGMAVIEREGGK